MIDPQPVHLIVGLGNPGPRYRKTRHNIGFHTADFAAKLWCAEGWVAGQHSLVARASTGGEFLAIAKPQTFMNRSGVAVRALVQETGVEISRLVVVHDDLDLPFGRTRIRRKGGHGGHNGVRSILDALGTDGFIRLKLGIGRPPADHSVVEHVLSPFSAVEEERLPELLGKAVDVLHSIVVEGPERAMSSLPN